MIYRLRVVSVREYKGRCLLRVKIEQGEYRSRSTATVESTPDRTVYIEAANFVDLKADHFLTITAPSFPLEELVGEFLVGEMAESSPASVEIRARMASGELSPQQAIAEMLKMARAAAKADAKHKLNPH
jgi:hypothetical protein